jgi:hypothetical protein
MRLDQVYIFDDRYSFLNDVSRTIPLVHPAIYYGEGRKPIVPKQDDHWHWKEPINFARYARQRAATPFVGCQLDGKKDERIDYRNPIVLVAL